MIVFIIKYDFVAYKNCMYASYISFNMKKMISWCGKQRLALLFAYDSAPDNSEELDESLDLSDSDWRSATFKMLSASELIDPKGDGECGKLGGVSLGRTFDMLFLKLLCGGIVVGRGGACRKLVRCATFGSSAVSMVVGKSTNFC